MPTPRRAVALAILGLAGALTPPARAADKPAKPEPPAAPAPDAGITQEPGGDVTEKEIADIPFEDFAVDNGFVGPIAASLDDLDEERRKKLDDWAAKLAEWEPGKKGSAGQRVRNLLAVCALSDIGRSEFEGEAAYVVFDKLRKDFSKDQLIRATAWVALRHREGTTVTSAPELDIDADVGEDQVRERTSLYAVKLLGRVLGKLPPKADAPKAEAPKPDAPKADPPGGSRRNLSRGSRDGGGNGRGARQGEGGELDAGRWSRSPRSSNLWVAVKLVR